MVMDIDKILILAFAPNCYLTSLVEIELNKLFINTMFTFETTFFLDISANSDWATSWK